MTGVIVVGAGIAGSALTRVLRGRGVPVTLVSAGRPHSLAATAVLRRAWHQGPERAAFDESLAWYAQWDIHLPAGAAVTSWQRADARPDADWRFINPAAPLLQPDVDVAVTAIGRNTVLLADGQQLTAGTVVRATGATGPLAIAGKVTWGGTWVAPGTGEGIAVHQYAPYKIIAAAAVGGTWRAGSSSATTQAKAAEAARKQLLLAREQNLVPDAPWELVTGARVKAPTGHWGRDPQGGWWLGGFHRTGYAIGPAAARQLADVLC